MKPGIGHMPSPDSGLGDRGSGVGLFGVGILLLGLLLGAVSVRASGPPLDMSGEWEAIPNAFVSAAEGGGPYDRLTLRLTAMEPGPSRPGVTAFEFRYTGRYLKHERHFLSASAPPNCGGNAPLIEHPSLPIPYVVQFTTTWHVSRNTDEVVITSITGLGEVDMATLPSPHGELQKGIEFSFTPRLGEQAPTDDAYARFDRRYSRFGGVIPSDRCSSFEASPVRDHGGIEMWKVTPAPAELDLTGTIRGQVKSLLPVTTPRSDHEVHRAQVFLYRQTEVIREQRAGEPDAEYSRYLTERRTLARPAAVLTPDHDGRFEFRELPLVALRGSGPVARWKPVRYTVQVASAETDEIVIDTPVIDPTRTEILFFQPGEVANLLPGDSVVVRLRPSTGLQAKRDLADDLSELGPENFEPIEDQVRAHLARLAAVPGGMTPSQDEGLRRAIWAQRLVRDSARYSETLLSAGLKAFASLMADAIGDMQRWEAEGVADARKTFQQVRDGGGNPRWSSQFNLGEAAGLPQRWQQVLQRGQNIEISDELIRLTKAAKVLLQEGLIRAGMDAATARETALGLEQTHLLLLNYIRTGTLRGTAKDLLKTGIKELLDDVLQPRLFDSSLPYSYTARVAPDLGYSARRMMEWNRSNPEAYLADRAGVVERLEVLGQVAQDSLRLAILLEATALAGDTTQKAAGVASIIPPARLYAAAVERFAKGVKYLSNGGGAFASGLFVFWGAPKAVREGVHAAYGDAAPALQFARKPLERRLAGLADPPALALPGTNQLAIAIRQLVSLIHSNQLGIALDLAGSSAADGYAGAWDAWRRQLEVLELHASGLNPTDSAHVGAPLLRLQESKATLWMARARFDTAVRNLFREVLGTVDAATNAPLYLAAKNEVRTTAAGLLAAMTGFSESTSAFPAEWSRSKVLPALLIEWIDPPAAREITSLPAEVRLRARISNLGGSSVGRVEARLNLLMSQTNLTVSTPLLQTVGTGTLARADATPFSGEDEAIVEWVLHLERSETPDSVPFQLELLEGGLEPSAFVSLVRNGSLRVSPELFDRDLDGLPDRYELAHGLDPNTDDGQLDLDSDGLTNIEEYRLGLPPNLADSDQDGLSDGEELFGGADGFVTNPRLADTDGDGTPDALDGDPTDESTTTAASSRLEPEVAVEPSRVVLSSARPVALVTVTNRGLGSLKWGTTTDNPGMVIPSSLLPATTTVDLLLLRLPPDATLREFGVGITTVTVHDVAGATPDTAEIRLVVTGDFGTPITLSQDPVSKGVILSWTAVTGRSYQVEQSEDLVLWQSSAHGLIPADSPGLSRTWTDPESVAPEGFPSGRGHRFYRVVPR